MSLLITFIPITFFTAIKVVVGDCNNYNHLAGERVACYHRDYFSSLWLRLNQLASLLASLRHHSQLRFFNLYYKMHVKSVSGRGGQFATIFRFKLQVSLYVHP